MKTLLLTFIVSVSFAKEFSSGVKQARLVELYTSESCSSCPPAEKWLNKFTKKKELWKDVVPVEFHVDYWNYLNWRDRFSKSEYTRRQKKYHNVHQEGVYTPQMIIRGNNSRSWNRDLNSSSAKVGKLKGKYNKKTKTLDIKFNNKTSYKNLKCSAALLLGHQETQVKSGENRGEFLTHEFIVTKLYDSNMSVEKKKHTCTIKLEKGEDINAIAIWVYDPKTLQVVQATGTYF